MRRVFTSQDDQPGWTGKRDKAETWAEFDRLPRAVKRFFWEAAYCYTAIGAVRLIAAGGDLRAEIARHRQTSAEDVRREARRLYGPLHPQARA